jgi:uncharacterized protein (DUF1697 family)
VPRYVAFLRAINVGGRIVKMDVLKREFEALGFADVETFIASGNVLFSSRAKDVAALEKKIERRLKVALGYDVETFIRTCDEVGAVAKYSPFPPDQSQSAYGLYVGFLADRVPASATRQLKTIETPNHTFHVNGREVYWLCREKLSETKMSYAVIERALKTRSTFRGINTIVRLTSRLSK